jgi:hypothetical protein
VVKAIPKSPAEQNPDAIEPDENAAPKAAPSDGTTGPARQ